MKKFFLIVVLAAFVAAATQTVQAQATKTISFTYLKDSLPTVCKEALAFANKGKLAQEAVLGDTANVIIIDIWDVTDVPSRSGKKETQQLLTYEVDGKDHYALVIKDKSFTQCGKVKTLRGDSEAVLKKYW